MTCAAKASLISARSMSPIAIPARRSACCDACTGPSPMISGDSALTPVETMRASGARPSCAALTSLITTSAAAPSFSGQQFPAVTVPCSRNTGLSVDIFSSVVPGLGPSSADTTSPDGRVTGVISRCQNPLARAFSARFCDLTPNSSCSAREMPRSDEVVDRGGVEPRHLRERGRHDLRQQFIWPDRGQRPLERPADRGAGGRDDDCLWHDWRLLVSRVTHTLTKAKGDGDRSPCSEAQPAGSGIIFPCGTIRLI